MSHILIERAHTLGLPAARQHAQTWADKATDKFGVQCRYETGAACDVLHFEGNGMQGFLEVSGQHLKLQAELGFLAAMFQAQIEGKLTAQMDALVQSSGQG